MNKAYRLIEGSAAQGFLNSRAKVRIYSGGFANGKTTALCIDALTVARDYPGCNIMLGRATFANLKKTVIREWYKWCPPNWIKSANQQDGTCVLINGTTIDFRYIAQQTAMNGGETTNNLLSANYDYIGVDQIEDSEITEEDFDQMLGRLRGMTPYAGDDETMPLTGPRFMALTCNPMLGWFYKRVVKPLHDLQRGVYNEDLICERDPDTQEPVLDEHGRVIPLVSLYEATTYENAQNLAPDYIKTLESTYRGRMRDRYMLGKWVAFEGVIYDEFEAKTHMVPHERLMQHITALRMMGYQLQLLEGYDFGITSPSCYLLALVDGEGVIYVVAGFYEPNMGVSEQATLMEALRAKFVAPELLTSEPEPLADPSIFRRTNAGKVVGKSTAQLFADEGIAMRRGNNDIMNGIVKVKAHLLPRSTVINPFTSAFGAPLIYFSDTLHWVESEFTTYRWQKNRDAATVDKPVDGVDHAMDTIKYMLSSAPKPASMSPRNRPRRLPSAVLQWGERDTSPTQRNAHRYGT